jgi:ribosome biogenesis GTPase A
MWDDAECDYEEAQEHDSTNLFWCNACELFYCGACWDKERLHQPRKRKPTAAHHKTDVQVAKLIDNILRPKADIESPEKRHCENIATKWFGVSVDENGKQFMEDFRRFESLTSDQENPSKEKFPCLVAFVGPTGAGKSTLINALMKACS